MSDLLRVTDHAVLRYLERVQGFDVEAVRRHIAKTCAVAAAMGAFSVRAEGVRFSIVQGAVVTIMPNNRYPSATHQRAQQPNPTL